MAKAHKTDFLDCEPSDTFYGVCSEGDLDTLQRFLLDPLAMRHLRCYIEPSDYSTFWLKVLVTCLAKKRGKTAAARERRTRMAHLMREKLMHLSDEDVSMQAREQFQAFIETEEELYYEQTLVEVVYQLLEWRIFSADDAQEAMNFVEEIFSERREKAAAEALPA
jgi:hypothetical protein